MSKAEEMVYKIEFSITYGEEIPPITKRTLKKVIEIIEKRIELHNYDVLHKLGYTDDGYADKQEKLLNEMLRVAKKLQSKG